MRRVKLLLVPWLLAVAVASALLLGPAAARGMHRAGAVVPQGQSRVIDVWSVVPSPSTSAAGNFLTGVSSVSAHDVWVVGYNDVPSSATHQAFAEHYNGTTWSMVSIPNPSSTDTQVNGVAAVSADDVWAVGSYAISGQNAKTLIEHWNGTAWNQVASPHAGTNGAGLAAITVVSASDIWAVGGYNDQTNGYPLFEHWNGTAWSIVVGANTGTNSAFVRPLLRSRRRTFGRQGTMICSVAPRRRLSNIGTARSGASSQVQTRDPLPCRTR
jgi:hypothetical protein